MALIVVVDDRVTNRTIFSKLAASIKAGAVVEAFSHPAAVLAWIGTNSPDLIITDYKMPGMDGADFVRSLRSLPSCQDVPVIVITAYEDREFRLRALDAGATDFLQSPVDHQEFVTRGRNLLNLGQQQKLIRCRAENLERELKLSEQSRVMAIREDRSRLIQVIDTIPAFISAVDAHGQRVFVNQYGGSLLPIAAPDVVPEPDPNDQHVMRSGVPMLGYEEEMTDAQGRRRTLLTSKFPLRDAVGAVQTVLTTSFDISDRKRAEQNLVHLAHHDVLTGLPNRLRLNEVLDTELSGVASGNLGFALHFLDLDRFKGINDGFGHHHGDRLLKVIAGRLLHTVRAEDTVARLGGDEFAVVQVNVVSAQQARDLANRITTAISEPIMIEQHKARIGASIGITIAPDDASSAEELLKNADLAMYRAKREGKSRARFFAAEMQTVARASVLLEIDLRQGVEQDEFIMCYQPQVDVLTERIVGAEALLRWRRPGHGLVKPQSFLPLAEDTGLIVPINRWVLREVCRQGAAWSAAGWPIRVGVNISSATFKAESVRELVVTTLDETGLDAALLELELTEGTLMENQREAADDLHALRRLGVRVAIDDFGTGYSSLAYLQHLPIDRLKIDSSFVRGLDSDANGTAVVDAVVGIGRSLSMEVLAEGVETAGQLRRVRAAGCQSVQGYYFSRALPADQFQAIISRSTQLPIVQPA